MEANTPTANTENPGYDVLESQQNVKVKCPGLNDVYLRIIEAHTFINNQGEKVNVVEHFRRGDLVDKVLVTKHFYIDCVYVGSTFTADLVNIRVKKDKDGKDHIVIDIFKYGYTMAKPESELKVGSTSGKDRLKIPGTDRFIKFKPIEVRVHK